MESNTAFSLGPNALANYECENGPFNASRSHEIGLHWLGSGPLPL